MTKSLGTVTNMFPEKGLSQVTLRKGAVIYLEKGLSQVTLEERLSLTFPWRKGCP